MDEKKPDPIPESCGQCPHFKKTGILDRFRGQCVFYDRTTYTTYTCFARPPAEDKANNHSDAGNCARGATGRSGAQADEDPPPDKAPPRLTHVILVIFFAALLTAAVASAIAALLPGDKLADDLRVIHGVHLVASIALLIAGFTMFGTARRLFRRRMRARFAARAGVRLAGLIPAACGTLFLLGSIFVLLDDVKIPQPGLDRVVPGPTTLDGPLADLHQRHARFIRLNAVIDAASFGIAALLLASAPGFVVWAVKTFRKKRRTPEPANEFEQSVPG